jgi:hypothetical protein
MDATTALKWTCMSNLAKGWLRCQAYIRPVAKIAVTPSLFLTAVCKRKIAHNGRRKITTSDATLNAHVVMFIASRLIQCPSVIRASQIFCCGTHWNATANSVYPYSARFIQMRLWPRV